MQADLITILLGFFEGLALILSPCILPILPVFLAGSLEGSRKRPLGIICGFSLFFAVVIYFSQQLVHYLGIDFNLLRHICFAILFLLGVILLSNHLSELFSRLTQGLIHPGTRFSSANNPEAGFFNGVLFGGLAAIIWTPCAGPILATIIVQTVMQKATLSSFLTLLSFAAGAALPMFFIAFYGRTLLKKVTFFKTNPTLLRKTLGAILVASVVYLVYFEKELATAATVSEAPEKTSEFKVSASLMNGLWAPWTAPNIAEPTEWFNSKPLSMQALKGKVVLIDFWTYSCINCIRTLPYLKSWYDKYHDQGLVIIGIHTPEFEFEKNVDNVKHAIKKNGILYPIALDNHFITWSRFGNQYWPAHYLINREGKVVYTHFGEGGYGVTENNIRFLLGMNAVVNESQISYDGYDGQTPETYLGYARAIFGPAPYLIHDKNHSYFLPPKLDNNAWGLEGNWRVNAESIQSASANAAVAIHFNARKVYVVMGNSGTKPIQVNAFLNGEPLLTNQGKDVQKGAILVDKYSIYEVVSATDFINGTLKLIATSPGLTIYTFTFGH